MSCRTRLTRGDSPFVTYLTRLTYAYPAILLLFVTVSPVTVSPVTVSPVQDRPFFLFIAILAAIPVHRFHFSAAVACRHSIITHMGTVAVTASARIRSRRLPRVRHALLSGRIGIPG